MELNDSALLEVFKDLVRSLEWAAREIEHLRQTICSDPELLKKYQETTPPSADVSLSSIGALRQRIE
jgi:hypothetical protein